MGKGKQFMGTGKHRRGGPCRATEAARAHLHVRLGRHVLVSGGHQVSAGHHVTGGDGDGVRASHPGTAERSQVRET